MANSQENFFLVIEGLDGSGKTEIVRRFARILGQRLKNNLLLTFEPHDPSCAGLYIRQILTEKLKTSKTTLALAFAVNRSDHNDREIAPFFSSGTHRVILCDRYYLSSLVYQSSPDISLEQIMFFNNGARRPDLTIFLDASIQTCYRRMRTRPENKELFETNLIKTKDKYSEAIEFLRKRGDIIVSVDANGDIPSVINKVIEEINQHGPRWLKLETPLFPDEQELDAFALNGEVREHEEDKLAELTDYYVDKIGPNPMSSTLHEALADIRTDVFERVNQMVLNDLGWLCIGYLKRSGYAIGKTLPWTELCAYELEFSMPMNIKLAGTLVLLSEEQRYDKIRTKIHDIMRLSSFMIVLDPQRYPAGKAYYEQSLVKYAVDGNEPNASIEALRSLVNDHRALAKSLELGLIGDKLLEALSPSTRVIRRDDVAKYLFNGIIDKLREEYLMTLSGTPELKTILEEFTEA